MAERKGQQWQQLRCFHLSDNECPFVFAAAVVVVVVVVVVVTMFFSVLELQPQTT